MEVAVNKKARFNYHILETIEAGIVLKGSEIKSIRVNGAIIDDAFVVINRHNEVSVINMHIPEYKWSASFGHKPTDSRKLLMNYSEIVKIKGTIKSDRLTLIPLKIYFKGSLLKMLVGLAKGKNTVDKREDIKKRDLDREIRRSK